MLHLQCMETKSDGIKQPVYLDYNATSPMDERVLEFMIPYFINKFGNASSKNHQYGWIAEAAVDLSRNNVAKLLNATEHEIIFTSGATEACNLAIKGVYESYSTKGNHIITCKTEHSAITDTYRYLEMRGARVTYLPVSQDGTLDIANLTDAISSDTILISLMYANNETGLIHPVKEISDIARKHQVLFFCDATQAVGKISVDVERDGIDLLALSAHKFYGPKGVGALYVRRRSPRVRIAAQIHGGAQQRARRAGTLNVPAIAGMGKAASLAMAEMAAEEKRQLALREKIEKALLNIPGTVIHAAHTHRLPQTINVNLGIDNSSLIRELKNVALSTGSACNSESNDISHVLAAMGISEAEARSSVRISFGKFSTEEEIDFAINEIEKAIIKLRGINAF